MRNIIEFPDWIGKKNIKLDCISLEKVALISATFDSNVVLKIGDNLPELWHWVFFNPNTPMSRLGNDGHPNKGEDLPPIDYPLRMWAGGEIVFHSPLKIGEKVRRESTIKDITNKSGKNGGLVFVSIEHEITGDQGGLLIERQNLVYKEAPSKENIQKKEVFNYFEKTSDHVQIISPNPILLFRYSALTFNSHRIHYDREYCINEEFYPGLVVQGPLTATLLVNFFVTHHPSVSIKKFSFRGIQPLFDFDYFTLNCSNDKGYFSLWVLNKDGYKAMEAIITI